MTTPSTSTALTSMIWTRQATGTRSSSRSSARPSSPRSAWLPRWVGAFLDLFPVSVLTTSTLERLSEFRPQTRFDQRRFRMNVIIGTSEPGFVENDWVGRELTIGDAVHL